MIFDVYLDIKPRPEPLVVQYEAETAEDAADMVRYDLQKHSLRSWRIMRVEVPHDTTV